MYYTTERETDIHRLSYLKDDRGALRMEIPVTIKTLIPPGRACPTTKQTTGAAYFVISPKHLIDGFTTYLLISLDQPKDY